MRETLEELKAIRDGAPSGAANYTGGMCYVSPCLKVHDGFGWDNLTSPIVMRALSDIEHQIELLELIDDIRALGFLEESHDSGVSHRKVCKRAKELLG